jgi:hypothetical protein
MQIERAAGEFDGGNRDTVPQFPHGAILDWRREGKTCQIAEEFSYDEKEEPQPQLLVELGLMKLKPWRMSVSSKSRTMPVR